MDGQEEATNVSANKVSTAKLEIFHSTGVLLKVNHSALKRNLMKVWKTWTGPLLGGRAWSRGLKSALSKILKNKEHFH